MMAEAWTTHGLHMDYTWITHAQHTRNRLSYEMHEVQFTSDEKWVTMQQIRHVSLTIYEISIESYTEMVQFDNYFY